MAWLQLRGTDRQSAVREEVGGARLRAISRSRGSHVRSIASCLVGITLLTAGGTASAEGAAHTAHRLTLYSLAEREQFMNNADARTRGEGPNPFGHFTDLAPTATPERKGPFPGDSAVFSLNVYSRGDLKTRAGEAVISCQYNFHKNAFCDASFQLSGGTLIAAGAFNFDASKFTLVVTGGYGRYSGATGAVEVTPSAHHAQLLRFELG